MNNDEIKAANRRALPKFLCLMAVLLVLGFVLGYLSQVYGLSGLVDMVRAAAGFFGAYVAPWLMVAIAIAAPAVCMPICRSARRLTQTWDGEDDAVCDRIDHRLSTAILLSSIALILTYFLSAAVYSGGTAAFEDEKKSALYVIALAALFAVIAATVIIQQKCVDAAKKINPEKTASIYDIKFQKKWMDSCDEAEKALVGRCAYKAYTTTNNVCAVSAGLLAAGALIFDIGFLPSLVVCLIWIVNQSFFFREEMRASGVGNK